MLQKTPGEGQQSALVVQGPPWGTHGAVVDVVDDVLVVVGPLVLVVDGDVVVVDEGQWKVGSHACPEQQTVAALHGLPSRVQQSQPEGVDWQCSYWTGQRPAPQLVLLAQTTPGLSHWHLFPVVELRRQVCPGGQLPPHIPAADPPEPGTNPHGIVVVVVVAVATVVDVVVEPPATVVVVAVVVVVVTHTAMPSAALPDWNAARSGVSSTASAASMFSASWLARPVQVSAETWVWQSSEPASVTEQSSPCPWSAESAAAPPRPSARTG